ncbi:MAG: hypothetical protein IJE19_03140 [Clostridia bacterium]|nr:hypothetical protein [Clostridia bacterium]
MDKSFTTDGIVIAKVMRDHLNSWPQKPVLFLLEDLGKNTPSLMIQQLAAAEKKKTYVNGSYIGIWNFAVYFRIDGKDTATRLDATACLEELAVWLSKQNDKGSYVNLPEIDDNRKAIKIELMSNPAIAARYDDGTEDYQALFSLEYKVRRN